jgi:hypothetical protein
MRWMFAVIVIISLSLIALFPSTFSVLQNTHTVSNISSPSNDIPCASCHSKIAAELNNSVYHTSLSCEDCHRNPYLGQTVAYDNGSIKPGEEAHAAVKPRCLDCHSKTTITLANGSVVAIAKADAFGDASYGSDYSAHKKFVQDALNFNIGVAENEACLSCHTEFSVGIEFRYFWNISYTKSGSSWVLQNFNVNGTRTYIKVLTRTGAKHQWINTTRINCVSCHKNIYDALVNGTPQSPYYAYTHSPIEIDSADYGGNTYGNWVNPKDHDWPLNNYWGNPRYHYIESNRAIWVNSTYCIKCHNAAKYANQNPSDSLTYDLINVTSDTNSTLVHAAESVRCITCHGYGKTKDPYDVIAPSGRWGNEIGHRNFMNQTESYARTFNGDMCMGCHEAAGHNVDDGAYESGSNMYCNSCHSYGGYARCGACHSDSYNYNIDVIIESEPSGNITHNTY